MPPRETLSKTFPQGTQLEKSTRTYWTELLIHLLPRNPYPNNAHRWGGPGFKTLVNDGRTSFILRNPARPSRRLPSAFAIVHNQPSSRRREYRRSRIPPRSGITCVPGDALIPTDGKCSTDPLPLRILQLADRMDCSHHVPLGPPVPCRREQEASNRQARPRPRPIETHTFAYPH
jgi:hypothetical protein